MKLTLAKLDAFQKAMPDDDWYFDGDENFVNDDFWEGKFDPSVAINVKPGDISLVYQGKEHRCFDESVKDFVTEFRKWKGGCDMEVLNPFNGTAATGGACKNTGRNYVGIEISEGYCQMSRERIAEGK